MATFRTGRVARELEASDELVRVRVELGDSTVEAVGFPRMLGRIGIGDRVVVNTTGIELGLGTGGEGFILWNLDGEGRLDSGPGHIVKLRYTPWQTEVLSAESPESEHHDLLADAVSIEGVPVIACGLHSQVGAVAAGIKAEMPEARVGYLMSDGAALPIAWSSSVKTLRSARLLDVTCTYGHAFGGDLEAVNIFSGLVSLAHAGEVDAIIVAMGPGVVGTATRLGSTALEQGQVLDAITSLGGEAIAALRISFVDERSRHAGVSHHCLTALTIAARSPATVVVPELPPDQAARVSSDLEQAGVAERHRLMVEDGGAGLRLLGRAKIRPTSMGRSIEDAPELFVAASAAGSYAGKHLRDNLAR